MPKRKRKTTQKTTIEFDLDEVKEILLQHYAGSLDGIDLDTVEIRIDEEEEEWSGQVWDDGPRDTYPVGVTLTYEEVEEENDPE